MIPRIATLFFAALGCVIASMVVVVVWSPVGDRVIQRDATTLQVIQTEALARQAETAGSEPSKVLHSVTIRRPEGPPRIELTGADPHGRVGSVACSTCHSVRAANPENRTAETLDEFHQGMTFDHGKIACYACHNPDDADTLRLADGTPVQYTDVMTLCAQCHGPQATSFAHGAHGGMNGFWDLSLGPQTKNNCIDCHDPHAPQYPKMIVGFKPKDRFNAPEPDHDHDHDHDQEDEASR